MSEDEAEPKPPESNARVLLRDVATDAGIAFVVTLVSGFVVGSLAAAGVITMGLARSLLFAAWLAGLTLPFVAAGVWRSTLLHKAIYFVALTVMMFGVERYEATHQPAREKPINEEELATRVAKKTASLLSGTLAHPSSAPMEQVPASTRAPTTVPYPVPVPQNPNAVLDNTISLGCSWAQLPETIPANGWIEIQTTLTKGIAYASSSYPPGSPNLAKAYPPTSAYRCRIVNHGSATALNVEGDIEVSFYEVITQENSLRMGNLIKSQMAHTPVANMPPGSTFDFYVRNHSYKSFVTLTPPSSVRVQDVGSDKLHEVLIVPSGELSFTLSPYIGPGLHVE